MVWMLSVLNYGESDVYMAMDNRQVGSRSKTFMSPDIQQCNAYVIMVYGCLQALMQYLRYESLVY